MGYPISEIISLAWIQAVKLSYCQEQAWLYICCDFSGLKLIL
jgi:hypothetical protein